MAFLLCTDRLRAGRRRAAKGRRLPLAICVKERLLIAVARSKADRQLSANTGHLAVLDRASEKVDLSHRTRLPGCAALRFVPPDHPDRSLH